MSEYRYYIKNTYKPVPDIVVIELADKKNLPVFDFKPGQYVLICYRNTKGIMEERHAFSLACSPTRKDSIRLGIRIMGKFTQGLAGLKKGHEIFVSGPFGHFVFDEGRHKDAVFIAGGVGITPFVSSLAYAAERRLANQMKLMYSSKTLKGAIFADEIQEIAEQSNNIRAIFSLTEKKPELCTGPITSGRINAQMIEDFIGDVRGKTFFLCGPVPFMDAMRDNLMKLGARPSQIKTEEFSMIPDAGMWIKTRNIVYALGAVAVVFAVIFYFIQDISKQDSVNSVNVPQDTGLKQPADATNGSASHGQTEAPRQTNPAQSAPDRRTRTS